MIGTRILGLCSHASFFLYGSSAVLHSIKEQRSMAVDEKTIATPSVKEGQIRLSHVQTAEFYSGHVALGP